MLELVCDQGYGANGVPVDRTPYRNHGRPSATATAPGPGGGAAIAFIQSGSAVALGQGGPARPFSPLGALRIEATIRVDDAQAAAYGVVVDGGSAFRLALDHGAPTIAVLRGGGLEQLRADGNSSPDGRLHRLPLGRWVELVAEHDGAANLRLFMDGALVAAKLTAPGGVDRVGAQGVTIGNAVGGGQPLGGALHRLRLWRHDPAAMRREFLCRPMTPETARCWEEIIRRVRAWMAADPAAAATLLAAVRGEMDRFLHALRARPEKEQDRLREALGQVLALWCRGEIAGTAMEEALADWRRAQRAAGIADPRADRLPAPDPRLSCPPLPVLEAGCDPEVLGFLRLLTRYLPRGSV